MWQDYVIGAGQLMFTVALIPSIVGKNKPAASTSGMTALILWAFMVTYLTLDMPGAAGFTSLCALAWTILCVQVILRRRHAQSALQALGHGATQFSNSEKHAR